MSTAISFFFRWVLALGLVFGLFNPHYSYFDWVKQSPNITPTLILAGLVYIGGWTILIIATIRSLGVLGSIFVLLFLGVVLWLILDFFTLEGNLLTNVILLLISLFLALGVYGSAIWRKLTGQVDVDDVG